MCWKCWNWRLSHRKDAGSSSKYDSVATCTVYQRKKQHLATKQITDNFRSRGETCSFFLIVPWLNSSEFYNHIGCRTDFILMYHSYHFSPNGRNGGGCIGNVTALNHINFLYLTPFLWLVHYTEDAFNDNNWLNQLTWWRLFYITYWYFTIPT